MIEKDFLRNLLKCLSPRAFDRWLVLFFNSNKQERFARVEGAPDGVYFQPLLDSYGGSLHGVFLRHYSQIDLLRPFQPTLVKDPELTNLIAAIWRIYKGQKGAWGRASPYIRSDRKLQSVAILTNLSGFSREQYEQEIIPAYSEAAKRLRVRPGRFLVGSYDSFLDLSAEETATAFETFVASDSEEVSISLDQEFKVRHVATEAHLSAGVPSEAFGPLEPVYRVHRNEEVLREFEDLLRKRASESELERFLTAHYNLIFGPEYDRIETQLWLRFPENDVGGKERRTDILLRNCVHQDWHLVELKLPRAKLTGTQRDVPHLSRELNQAIGQVRNYHRILTQDHVRSRFAREGIEYFEPSLQIVIGRSPSVPTRQWRWLISHCKDVRITSYDELLKEATLRAADRSLLTRYREQSALPPAPRPSK
jgi:hypothetical protein